MPKEGKEALLYGSASQSVVAGPAASLLLGNLRQMQILHHSRPPNTPPTPEPADSEAVGMASVMWIWPSSPDDSDAH